MSVIIFAGPTIKPEAISEVLDARILPPVRQGDVYRVAKDRPDAIGIIDGYFEGVPSVWHKEILWAMEQGIPVFGSASMGALRASELADFGMIGVGQIFEDYYSGVLQDDDEVAVLHSPAELAFQPLSVPMVSVRATVAQAVAAGILSAQYTTDILKTAKSIHYRQRTWTEISNALTNADSFSAFWDWLPIGEVDAKADDAKAMLGVMSEHLSSPALPHETPEPMERTLVWKALRERIDEQGTGDTAIINELRLNPDLFSTLRERAMLTLLAREETTRRNMTPDRDAVLHQMSRHRSHHDLPRQSDLMMWLNANDLSLEQYEAMLTDAARLDATISARSNRLDEILMSELRHTGRYEEFRNRAFKKADMTAPFDRNVGANRLNMVVWYFETHLNRDVPDDLDAYAVSLGLPEREALYDLIEVEFLYCQNNAGIQSSGT